MKKLFSLMMILTILLAAPISVSAKSVITIGEWTVEKSENEFSVVSCSSAAGDITLIREIGGWDVTAVGEYAFSGSGTLRSFTAFAPLREIGGYAFQNAARLHTVSLPYTLTRIGVFAFAGTSLLRDIDLEDTSVEEIPAYAFMSSGIQSVSLPKACTYIANNAFLNCRELNTVYIPDTVTAIGEKAFDGCDDLTILCAEDSYAAQYAQTHHIGFKSVVLCGDADSDGVISVIDATVIQRSLAGLSAVSGFNEAAADVDRDGLDIVDATYIRRFLADINIPYSVGELMVI